MNPIFPILEVGGNVGTVAAIIIALFGAGGVGAVITKIITKWLQHRRQGGREIRALRKDEFEHLSAILDSQGGRIQQLEKENSSYLQTIGLLHETIARLQLEIGMLRERVRGLESAANSATAVVEADSSGLITGWNAGAQSMFHYELAEALGQPIAMLIPPKYLKAHQVAFAAIVAEKTTPLEGKGYDFFALRKGGAEIAIRLKLSGWERHGQMFFTAEISRR